MNENDYQKIEQSYFSRTPPLHTYCEIEYENKLAIYGFHKKTERGYWETAAALEVSFVFVTLDKLAIYALFCIIIYKAKNQILTAMYSISIKTQHKLTAMYSISIR